MIQPHVFIDFETSKHIGGLSELAKVLIFKLSLSQGKLLYSFKSLIDGGGSSTAA